MASARRGSRRPVSLWVSAAAFLIQTCATTNGQSGRSSLIGKFSRARSVCTPYSASAATCFGPSGSFSVRNASAIVVTRAKGERGRSRRGPRSEQNGCGSGEAGESEQCDAHAVQPSEGDAPRIVAGQRVDRATGRHANRFDARRDDELRNDRGYDDRERGDKCRNALRTPRHHHRDEPNRGATPEEGRQYTSNERSRERASRKDGEGGRSDHGTHNDRRPEPRGEECDDGDASVEAGAHRLSGRTAPVRNGLVRRSRSSVVRGPCPGYTTVSPGSSEAYRSSEAFISAGFPSGRSVRPIEPAKSRSPPNETPCPLNATSPGA